MNIRDPRRLKKVAAHRLENAPNAGKILMIFTAFLAVSSLLVTGINYGLGEQISQTGGLGSIGIRSLLATIQTILPIIQGLAVLAAEFGYMAAMLRIARGQYTSPMTMKMGMERFWVLLRSQILQGLFYTLACFGGTYLVTLIFSVTPLSRPVVELLEPMLEKNLTDPQAVVAAMDEATQLQFLRASLPMFVLVVIVCLALVIPMTYRYRMVNYILMDFPGIRAMQALRSSTALMRGNKFRLFLLDLRYWWYYGLLMLASLLCYGDMLLPMMGISLPFSTAVSYFLFYILYVAATLGIYLLLRNKVEVTYALAYESIRPKAEPSDGVVLGNIFQQ